MSREKYDSIVAEFLKNKALVLKYIKDPTLLAEAIEKITYHRDLEMRKAGLFYRYELGTDLDYRTLITPPKMDV